jgi:hypothetical protein
VKHEIGLAYHSLLPHDPINTLVLALVNTNNGVDQWTHEETRILINAKQIVLNSFHVSSYLSINHDNNSEYVRFNFKYIET